MLFPLVGVAATTSVTLAWDRNSEPNLAGYNVYYGTSSRVYPGRIFVGSPTTNATVTGLQQGSTYFFAVTATNTAGLESDYSAEISYTIPLPNTAPVANSQNVSTPEDTPRSVVLSGSDADGDALTYTVLTQPTKGGLSGTAPNLTYTPAANVYGSDSFTFRVNDGSANSATATVSITINPVNDAPVAKAQSVTTPEDTAKAIVLAGSDVDGNTLTFAVVTQPTKGVLSGTAPNLTYTPNANASGSDSLTFRVNDGTVNSAAATVSITITPVNDAPVAIAQSVSTPEDAAKAITLGGTDEEGSSLTFAVVSQPTKGSLGGTPPNLTYTPNANFNGGDSFTFRANDGTVNSAAATVSITVTPVNDAPVANNQSVTTPEDTAKTITLGGSDVDGDALSYAVVAGPAHGTLSGVAPTLSYTPAANYNGSDSFTFRASDGTTNSPTATVSITVTPVNNAPVAIAQSVTTLEDTAKSVVLGATDSDGDTLIYTVIAAPTKGALSGSAPNLTYTPAANANGSDSFTFRANDGTVNSATATVSITITPVNDAPVANNQSVAAAEDTAKAVVLSGSDVDGDPITYSIVAGPTKGSLSGSAPNLTYTPAANANGSDSFTFRANDGTVNSATATVSITITPVNDAPVANSQNVAAVEDTAKAITLSGSDPDGDSVTYAIASQPVHGTLGGTAPNLTYTPAANYNGSDAFTFRVNDGTANSASATVTISVAAVNDAPVANPQSVAALEDAPKAITLTGSDVEGDALTYTVAALPAHGSLKGVAPNLTYLASTNYFGSDSFTFRVSDGVSNSALATVSITITAVNELPVANAQSVTTLEDTAKSITLTGSDPDGNPLTYTVVTPPAHGALSGAAPNLTYTPGANYSGSDSFTFKANDGQGDSPTATVSIQVTGVNDAPVANVQSTTTPEDTSKAILLTGSDADGDSLAFVVVTPPAHGTLGGTPPSVNYTPAANYAGADSFSFKVNDGTTDSPAALVSISVTAVNDAPVASAQSVTTAEDTAKAITLAGTDADGNALVYSVVSGPAHGTLAGTAPNLTYRPATNYNGADSFSFKVNDGTVDSTAAVVSVTVTPLNDAPSAIAQSVGTDRNVPVAITLSGSDVDADSLTYTVATQPAKGVLSGSAPNLTYTPNSNVTGTDSFTFRVSDGALSSAAATVAINIAQGPNTVPVASAQSVTTAEDAAKAITLSGTDADGDALTYAVVTPPGHGALSGTAPNLTYTPSANFNGSDSFAFKANDGTADSTPATIVVTVSPVNDAPVAAAQSVTATEDTGKAITLAATDVDGDALNFSVVANPQHGTLSGSTPNLVYTPAANYNGTDSFTFVANDGKTNSATALISINVVAANDAPIASAQSVTTTEDNAKAITLSGTDSDGDGLTYSIVTPPAHGTLAGSGAGRTYTPAADYNGTDSFTFKANDGTVDSAPATVSITITPANDQPVADSQSITALEDAAKSVTLTGSDVDGDSLTFTIVNAPTHGTLSGSAPSLTYRPDTNYSGADGFTFLVNDGKTNSASATVSINVTPGNDAPVALTQNVSTDEDTAKAITLSASDTDGDPLTYTVVTPPAHGTLNGTAPNLSYVPAPNYSGSDSFWFKASDAASESALEVVAITVKPVNDAPTANAIAVATDKNTARAIVLTGSDVDGDALTFVVAVQPTKGALSGSPPNLTYAPNNNVTGSDSFTYRANDGTTNSALATVSISIAPGPNTPPTAIAQSISSTEDAAKTITLGGSDADGDTLTFTVVNPPTHGTLSGTPPSLTYTPAANFNGNDSLQFKANDGTVDSSLAVISITVSPVNDAPVANAQSLAAVAGTAKPVTLTGSDIDGDSLTFTVASQPAHGTLTGSGASRSYTATAGYSGPDAFTFTVNDGTVSSSAATVSITVSPAPNKAPVASAQSIAATEDTAKPIVLAGSDSDGDTLSFSIVSQPSHGTLNGTPPNVSYLPSTNYSGTDSFTFRAYDGTDYSPAATISLSIAPVNDAPTLTPIANVTVSQDSGTKAVAFSGVSAGPGETQTLTVAATSSDPGLIPTPTVTYASPSSSGSLSFAPVAGTTGTAQITVTVNDGQSQNNTVSQTFSVTVEAVASPITLDPIADMTVDDTASPQVVTLTGISAPASSDTESSSSSGSVTEWFVSMLNGRNKKQPQLTVTASSSDTRIIPTPTVSYTSPDATATLAFKPATGAAGTATITVVVADGVNPSTSRSFAVTVTSEPSKPSIVLSSPAAGSSHSAPETIVLTADVNANGHAISKVQFFAGSTLLGEDASAPYAADWDCEAAGTYTLVARAIYDSSASVDSPAVTLSVGTNGLPAPWETMDIGSVTAPGGVQVDESKFTVQGAGAIEGEADSFRFVYQPLTADGEIWVKIEDLPSIGAGGLAGVMVREQLSSGSPYVFIGRQADGSLLVQARKATGEPANTTVVSGTKPADWVRILRKNDLFVVGYAKKQGSWSIASLENITMAPNIYIGLAVASGDAGTLNKATFGIPAVTP